MHEMPKLTAALIKDWVGSTLTKHGRDYFKRDKVLEFGDLDDGQGMYARVESSTSRVYRLSINFDTQGGLNGQCECSIGRNCKHVVAALYEIMQDQKASAKEVDEPAKTDSFSMWLGALDKAESSENKAVVYSENVKQRLLYILEPVGDGKHVGVHCLTTRILKDHTYGKANVYNPSNILGHNVPQYLLSSDESILRAIAKDPAFNGLNRNYTIKGEEGLDLLRRMVATERCHWLSKSQPALSLGEKCHATWQWQTNPKGDQYLRLLLDESMEEGAVIATLPPWYVDAKQHVCGAIESGQLPDVAELLLNMPAVPLDCDDEWLAELAEDLPDGVPMPERLLFEERRVTPTPVVRLISREMPHPYRMNHEVKHLVALSFDYDGHQLAHESQNSRLFRTVSKTKVVDFERDEYTEKEAEAALVDAGLYVLRDDYKRYRSTIPSHYFTLHDDHYWPEWVLHEVPVLKERGFEVEIASDFAYRMETATNWQLKMGEGPQNNNLMGSTSFTVTLGDGEEVDLIAVLARWVGESPSLLQEQSIADMRGKKTIPLPLLDGRMLAAPGEMIANILHFMLDVFASHKTTEVMLSAPQMLALEESLKDIDEPIQISSSVWLQHMKQLSDIERIPECTVPQTLRAELRDYQHEGLNWMQFLAKLQLNGILADDMGLGKTVQALSHILSEQEQGRLQQPAIVIAPTSLMYNWRRESEKFAPNLKVLVLHGSERAQHFDHLHHYDLVLTTYPLLVRDFEVLQTQPWHLLILDEAQYIKNPRSKVAQHVRKLQASHKLCLTGTPMENHLGELWAQFDFLMPGYLYDQRNFTQVFRKPIEREGDVARQEALNLRIRPFLLRRSKEDVAAELPPKTVMIRSNEMLGQQREMYESVRLAMQKKVRDAVATLGIDKSQIIVLDALLKMRQVCCDPRLLKSEEESPPSSAKLEMLKEMLPEMIEEGRRILLFSQFTGMLKLIEAELQALKIDYVTLTGQTKDRATPIDRFQGGDVPLFLISLKAGGVGLNLTAADTVIHYDPWWNPAAENQATDRAHRIGQDKSVFVYKLITEGTVEEKILEMQERKRALAAGIYEKSGAKKPLWTEDDMASLFAPLS